MPEVRAVVEVCGGTDGGGALHCDQAVAALPGPVALGMDWRGGGGRRPLGEGSGHRFGDVRVDRVTDGSPVARLAAQPL